MDILKNNSITKGKMTDEVNHKKLSSFLDEEGRRNIVQIIQSGAVGEIKQQQLLDNDAQTITIKFYYRPDR